MIQPPRRVLAQSICLRALRHLEIVGHFGVGFEARLGRDPSALADLTPVALVAKVRKDRATRGALVAVDKDVLLRLASLFSDRMLELLRQSRLKRRPDALRLAAQMTANPEYPQSYAVARYCLTMMLRSRYGLAYGAATVSELRAAYERLRKRLQQHKRRELKRPSASDRYLLDVLCLDEHIERSFSDPTAYWSSYTRCPLGIRPDGFRPYPTNAPQLEGNLPDFASTMNDLWAQPTAVEGLDEILGGLLPAMPSADDAFPGGLVTLVCGPPGSGKTTFCMTVASRMAELGSTVRYLATEESAGSLRGRRAVGMEPRPALVWPGLRADGLEGDIQFVDGSSFAHLDQVVGTLAIELGSIGVRSPHPRDDQISIAPVFRRVVVIDSLTALMGGRADDAPRTADGIRSSLDRHRLVTNLETLRHHGVCVFLVGGEKREETYGGPLAFLVDNVLDLGFEEEPTGRHPLRTLSVSKTRYQASRRGRHILHLSRHRGCQVSPSLHAVLTIAKAQPWVAPETGIRVKLADGVLELRRYSQTLIYGRGSAGKAGFALSTALAPRARAGKPGPYDDKESALAHTRVLTISFLYEDGYYRELAGALIRRRIPGISKGSVASLVGRTLDVMSLYPGYIDPETLVAKVRLRIARARLEGRPFSAVVIDGVHNLLLQFPLLYPEPLVWPTLYRLLRGERMDVITTFTFFRVASLEQPAVVRRPDYISASSGPARPGASNVGASAELFFHMLVSSCDYTFLMERVEDLGPPTTQVRLMTSIDGQRRVGKRLTWSSTSHRLKALPTTRQLKVATPKHSDI